MEAFAAQFLKNPIVCRAAKSFLEPDDDTSRQTILVGKNSLVAPIDKVQMVLHSGFWQRLTEDKQPITRILEAFDIPHLYDPTFLRAWLIANGILPLPVEKNFENIYCDYLMIDGYIPSSEAKKQSPAFYCESGTVVCKGVVTSNRIIETARSYPQFVEELITENTPEYLDNVKTGPYYHAPTSPNSYSYFIWHHSIPQPKLVNGYVDDDGDNEWICASFGGADGTEDVYFGDAWYEPNNDELIKFSSFSCVMSKNPRFPKRAIGFFQTNGGDQGKSIHYLCNKDDEIVAFYV